MDFGMQVIVAVKVQNCRNRAGILNTVLYKFNLNGFDTY